jgi:hypothetical protein
MSRKDLIGTQHVTLSRSLPAERDYDVGIFAIDASDSPRGLLLDFQDRCERKIVIDSTGDEIYLLSESGTRVRVGQDSVKFVQTLRAATREIRNQVGRPLSMLIDINNISRVHLGSIVGQIYVDKIFGAVDYIYRIADYYVDDCPAASKYNDDIFLQSVLENSTPYVPVPYLGGAYSSSPRMHMLVSCGLDVRLQVPRLRTLEPYRTDLVIPETMKDGEVLQRIGLGTSEEREKSNVHLEFLGPKRVFEYVSYLRSWETQLQRDDKIIRGQGVIFSVGWKTHHLMAALWCVAESAVPVLTTARDYVTRIAIKPTADVMCINIRNIGAPYPDV